MAAEAVAGKYGIVLTERESGYRIGRGSIGEQKVFLAEPLLYMNLSGQVVQAICRKIRVRPERLVVIHDDMDMETGKLRIRKTGSSGGHRGIGSVIQSIGSRDFIRVKIGIGREPGTGAEEYVLGKFSREEIMVIKEAIQRASDAVSIIVADGVDKAMNRFNA